MTQGNNFLANPINQSSLVVKMVIGGAIALLIIGAFLFSAGQPNPEWGNYWMIKPLIMVPLAGAIGGLVFYFINLPFQTGWKKISAALVGILLYIFVLWIGTVLGLNGTFWN